MISSKITKVITTVIKTVMKTCSGVKMLNRSMNKANKPIKKFLMIWTNGGPYLLSRCSSGMTLSGVYTRSMSVIKFEE